MSKVWQIYEDYLKESKRKIKKMNRLKIRIRFAADREETLAIVLKNAQKKQRILDFTSAEFVVIISD